MTASRVAVYGATGFVGSHVAKALTMRGVEVMALRAPRVGSIEEHELDPAVGEMRDVVRAIADETRSASAVVNAAGVADATTTDRVALLGPNAVLPGLIASATRQNAQRLIHVSSAAVQGRTPMLDDTDERRPFSPYSRSKAYGEVLALRFGQAGRTCIYRPAGVHGADRAVTQSTIRIARSRLSSVAGPMGRPTPQALVENVADAIAFLATMAETPPAIVTHPSEGLTTESLLELLSGKSPAHLPASFAATVIKVLARSGRQSAKVATLSRRLEMLWLGQAQAPSWLDNNGWTAPYGIATWRELGKAAC